METQEAKMSRLKWRMGSRAPGKSLTSETCSITPFYRVPVASGQVEVEPVWLKRKPVLPQI